MKKVILIFFCVTICCIQNIFAQDIVLPKLVLKTADDYAKYEKDVINAARWLQDTPFNVKVLQRKQVSAFIVKWVGGSPTVLVEMYPVILDFDQKNEGMLVLFMAGCARYVLENNDTTDAKAKYMFAFRGLISMYKSGNGISKDKKMEKLIKLDESGKLDEWLKENFPFNK